MCMFKCGQVTPLIVNIILSLSRSYSALYGFFFTIIVRSQNFGFIFSNSKIASAFPKYSLYFIVT